MRRDLEPARARAGLVTIRRFEEACLRLKNDGEIPGSIHLCIGQEAVPVGACSQLDDDDAVTATYRGHGWALARGVDPAQMLAEMMGRESTLSGGRGGSPYFSDRSVNFLGENSIVGAGVPIAVGAALDAKVRRRGCVSLVSIGEGALNQGATHEALNFAGVFGLPLIVVVEDNVYSEMTPWRDLTSVDRLADRIAGYAIPALEVDGNDPWAVAAAVSEARERAVASGPSVVIAATQRLVGHYSGDAQLYRPAGEVEALRAVEPLAVFADHAARAGHPPIDVEPIDDEASAAVEEAVVAARTVPEPRPDEVESYVYA